MKAEAAQVDGDMDTAECCHASCRTNAIRKGKCCASGCCNRKVQMARPDGGNPPALPPLFFSCDSGQKGCFCLPIKLNVSRQSCVLSWLVWLVCSADTLSAPLPPFTGRSSLSSLNIVSYMLQASCLTFSLHCFFCLGDFAGASAELPHRRLQL
eukprot:245216-Pelagomonas_calceolata.AAC.1